jgi:hypothetical protein
MDSSSNNLREHDICCSAFKSIWSRASNCSVDENRKDDNGAAEHADGISARQKLHCEEHVDLTDKKKRNTNHFVHMWFLERTVTYILLHGSSLLATQNKLNSKYAHNSVVEVESNIESSTEIGTEILSHKDKHRFVDTRTRIYIVNDEEIFGVYIDWLTKKGCCLRRHLQMGT